MSFLYTVQGRKCTTRELPRRSSTLHSNSVGSSLSRQAAPTVGGCNLIPSVSEGNGLNSGLLVSLRSVVKVGDCAHHQDGIGRVEAVIESIGIGMARWFTAILNSVTVTPVSWYIEAE